ncbi:MAG: hypothetical protein M1825_002056 [Sarcosagium campestre]|nr:MAG: hypothetical protein M1825_002056 [Sarcosagium campestre]
MIFPLTLLVLLQLFLSGRVESTQRDEDTNSRGIVGRQIVGINVPGGGNGSNPGGCPATIQCTFAIIHLQECNDPLQDATNATQISRFQDCACNYAGTIEDLKWQDSFRDCVLCFKNSGVSPGKTDRLLRAQQLFCVSNQPSIPAFINALGVFLPVSLPEDVRTNTTNATSSTSTLILGPTGANTTIRASSTTTQSTTTTASKEATTTTEEASGTESTQSAAATSKSAAHRIVATWSVEEERRRWAGSFFVSLGACILVEYLAGT